MVNESGQRTEVEEQSSALPAAPPARDEPPEVEQLPGPKVEPTRIEPMEEEVVDDEPSEDEPSEDEPTDESEAEPQADDRRVLAFPTPAKPKRGRKPKSGTATCRVDYVKESKNTWTFRIRWKEPDGSEPAAAVSRVTDQFFHSITKGKVKYAAFKKQLIAGWLARAVRQGDRTDAGAHRSV